MEDFDVIVVGGGPAGSACATELVREGADVVVLDREVFPRNKLCAGWITPEVVAELELDVDDYPHRFNTFDSFLIHAKGLSFALRTVQHSIRRFEFDEFLLKRSGATVRHHDVREIAASDQGYVVGGQFAAKYLVGAGGTRCPVYRKLFRSQQPRRKSLQTTTYEHEFPYRYTDPRCHLWFFQDNLPGYAWYVPKADGYLNCGVGAVAEGLKQQGKDIKTAWQQHVKLFEDECAVQEGQYAPKGYSYFLRDRLGTVRLGNAFITGDAVGLATRDLGEGIGPAVISGKLAAAAILGKREYSLDHLDYLSVPAMIDGRWYKGLVDWLVRRRVGLA